jgi:outer membrane protein assembly factor BamE (lipoprotein component of BamABCDE complex)
MKFHYRMFLTLSLISALAGCAIPSAIQIGTSADELQQKLGKPTAVKAASGGGEFWEYAYGPEGTETWLYRIDQGRVVRSAVQLLTEERLQKIQPGVSTEADVRELLGTPRDITRFSHETAWEWRVRIGPDYGTYVVRFGPDGRAIGYNVLKDFLIDGDKDSGP